MVKLNSHFFKLRGGYFFAEIERRIALFQGQSSSRGSLFNLGIGDLVEPLPPSLLTALVGACEEMGRRESFRGYGPAEGYLFLREKIAAHEYANCSVSPDEIFISDGAQSDMAHFQELFDGTNRIAVLDPTYPAYVDANVMAGRTGNWGKEGKYEGITYLACTEENQFQPTPPSCPLDLIYLCCPNNPTGVSFERAKLEAWVEYAKRHGALLLIDGAYSSFVTGDGMPRTIYEIPGAKEVAVEFRTFSKSAGFTGLRCSYTVVPKEIFLEGRSLRELWKRRQETKFNGVAYPIQRAAEALFSPAGKQETGARIASYLQGTRCIRERLLSSGLSAFGGFDAPYVWCKAPEGMGSWDFFDFLLQKHQIISVPGSGFGKGGEGFIRFSGFVGPATIEGAMSKINATACYR
ncbi:MAG: LL-diaminopimelate aminotransferase [Verrucomicrobiota bacterium]|nr:LL-diaminopimelate aminotransferase [Verrucomicrobiota bacterium]